MVGKMKKQYEAGEATRFMTRNAALKKLQLSLKDFRRICILKGIYPREPRNRKRAQKGKTDIKTLYHKKDIQFLMHEPIIWKLRDYKVFFRKRGRAKALRDSAAYRRIRENEPKYTLDHIVKERYPTFIDAIRDLDDCLTLTFLFSTFPRLRIMPPGLAFLCRRLTIEFLHYVIEAKALRKVFVSIKGYYYQAEIKGQKVTWVVPHHFAFAPQTRDEVDFRIMSTFVEFYTTLLGFVNFRLYHALNLYYPPQLPGYAAEDAKKEISEEGEYVYERIAALNVPLSKTVSATEEESPEMDEFPVGDNQQKVEDAKKDMESLKVLKKLFEGLKFFVNREVPREPLVFVIRAFGGEISWDKVLFPGATYPETDETITHQIVDRLSVEKQYLSRYYVQPQWVFDSVNARQLLPPEDYFMGAVLPPHLSPFVEEKPWMYVPPEEEAFRNLQKGIKPDASVKAEDDSEDEDEEIEGDDESEIKVDSDTSDDDDDDDDDEEDKEEVKSDDEEKKKEEKLKQMKQNMKVNAGSVNSQEENLPSHQDEREQLRLREKMIRKKHKKIYRRMMDKRHQWSKEVWLLKKKRTRIDEENKEERKTKKKLAKMEAITESLGTPLVNKKKKKKAKGQ